MRAHRHCSKQAGESHASQGRKPAPHSILTLGWRRQAWPLFNTTNRTRLGGSGHQTQHLEKVQGQPGLLNLGQPRSQIVKSSLKKKKKRLLTESPITQARSVTSVLPAPALPRSSFHPLSSSSLGFSALTHPGVLLPCLRAPPKSSAVSLVPGG